MAEFEEAIDKVMAGPERKSRVISKKSERSSPIMKPDMHWWQAR